MQVYEYNQGVQFLSRSVYDVASATPITFVASGRFVLWPLRMQAFDKLSNIYLPTPLSTLRVFALLVPAYPPQGASYTGQQPHQPQQPEYREIQALEYRTGDMPLRYTLTIPDDAEAGQIIRLDLGGRQMSVRFDCTQVHTPLKCFDMLPYPSCAPVIVK